MNAKGSQETYFAQHLASNDPKIRGRAMKKLARWLQARANGSKGLVEDDLLKVWKGLFYCMWMSDKPLVQEGLADKISQLVHCFQDVNDVLLFIETFFLTMAREWFGIDRFRLEKFMMLIRRFLSNCFLFLKSRKFKLPVVRQVIDVLQKNVIHPTNEDIPTGLKFHIIDVYMDELGKASGYELSTKQICWFLKPFGQFLVACRNNILCESVLKEVFYRLIYDAVDDSDNKVDNEEAMKSKFIVDFNVIADRLVQVAAQKDIRQTNRARLYKLIGRFRDTAQGVFPFDREIDTDSGDEIGEDEIDAAAKALLPIGRKRQRLQRRKSRR